MQRALELAQNGLGSVAPNPLVGCVIVCENKIIGEGWHQKFGGPHAEVNAVNSIKNQELLSNSTVYVNLEPCAHHGKTPPCADMLVKHQVKKVVIANEDPNPLVNGGGIKKLQEAGVEVTTGVLADSGLELNRRFFTYQKKQRPYIILKWARTADGFVARSNYDSKWISNNSSRKLVHKWRGEEQSILVGFNTAQYDDPQLTVRDWFGKNPLRLVVDKNLELSSDLQLFDGNQKTICYNMSKDEEGHNLIYKKVSSNIEEDVLADLYNRKIQSVIIEGGASTLQRFISLNLWDEARVFIGDKIFGSGIKSPTLNKGIFAQENIENDRLLIYKNY